MKKFVHLNKEKNTNLKFDKKGKYIIFFHNLSGKFVFELAAEGVEVDIYGIYTGKNNDDFQIETVQHHTAPSATSNLFIKGVFEDESKFHYQGLIRLEKSAQQSHAYQRNQNLILSSKSFVESKPYLEILANDVFCTHGSTTGKLNKDEVFYAKTRGLSDKVARQMLVDGFINDIYNRLQMQGITF